jgi:hypothetical protein
MYRPPFFLLQTVDIREFQIQPNPVHGVIFLVGVTMIVLVVVFLNKSKKIQNSKVFKSGAMDTPELVNHEGKELKKATNAYGLNFEERRFLDNIFHKAEINPPAVFDSVHSIDAGFSKAIRALGREEDADADIAKLFAIRNKIEYYLAATEAMKNPSPEKMTVRRYKRIDTNIPVVFYLVTEKEEQAGLKKVKKLSLDSVRHTGSILDISSGGCAVSTHDPCKTGMRLKLEFKIGRTSGTALVQVLRINQNRSDNVLHARFLKVSVKSLNAINAFIFDYNDI